MHADRVEDDTILADLRVRRIDVQRIGERAGSPHRTTLVVFMPGPRCSRISDGGLKIARWLIAEDTNLLHCKFYFASGRAVHFAHSLGDEGRAMAAGHVGDDKFDHCVLPFDLVLEER